MSDPIIPEPSVVAVKGVAAPELRDRQNFLVPPIRLSQGHLTLLSTCPRKFQHLFLEQLSAPESPEQQEKMLQGAQFHLVLQQWLLQLPIEPLVQEDAKLHQWFQTFQTAAPVILDMQAEVGYQQQPECDRSLDFQGYRLMTRYDLLMTSDRHAKILDWKTYPQPRQTQWLQHHWQTRLYPFVLAETSDYSPEEIAMVYWFFQARPGKADHPQSLTFRYSQEQHEQTRQDLSKLLAQLTDWLQCYEAGEPFPQITWGSSACEDCTFAVRCGRTNLAQNSDAIANFNPSSDPLPENLPNLADIEEIPL